MARDQAALKELRGIRTALERIATVLELITVEEEPTEPGCLHPEEQRIDFGITNGVADWQCRACGYRTTEA